MNVHDEPSFLYGGYTTPEIVASLTAAQEKKAKKILVHYGHKCKQNGINHFTLMKGASSHAGELLCRAVKQYNIHNVVTGRRSLSSFRRFFQGSTSQYLVENADCNVIVVKVPPGPEEEHDEKDKVIQLEEEERIRRVEEEAHILEEEEKKREEKRQYELEKVRDAEEKERQRRISEDSGKIHVFAFHEELKQKNH